MGVMLEIGMRTRLTLGSFLFLLLALSQAPLLQVKIACGLSPSSVTVDLYTQKEPYGGKGPNQPSDAFAPQELVLLYALVSYNDAPVPGVLVGFEVFGPINPIENISIFRTASTGTSGIANMSFRIPSAHVYADQVLFGSWTAVATAEVGEISAKDTLSFNVGWIVQPLKVDCLDTQNMTETKFFLGDLMHFRVTINNIAMTTKVATLTVAAFDNASAVIGQIILKNQTIPPGTSILYTGDLAIPSTSAVGEGTVFVNAYTLPPELGGAPWSPEITVTFEIASKILRDVAVVNVEPFPTRVYQGGIVTISVTVENKGEMVESFNVSVFYDSRSVGAPIFVRNLAVGEQRTLALNWTTASVVPGQYNISARASPVPGETNLANNLYVDGMVDVLPSPTPPPPPSPMLVELSWLLLLVLLIALILTGLLLGFALGRRSRKKENSPPKDDARTHPYCMD